MNIYDIWFSRIDISNDIKLRLLENFAISNIWSFRKSELLNLGLKESTVNQILDIKYKEKLEKYEAYLLKHKIDLITLKDIDYPEKLLNISNRPAYIYVRGNKNILDDDSVAIIGSRSCTENGRRLAYNTAKELGDKNINTISGLAVGIDTYAHKGSLNSLYGKTVAVLANGLAYSDIYPSENLKLVEQIIENGGAVISEYIVGTKAKKYYFPIRNRIVSGLSNKILVVEANEKSGTLITVRIWLKSRKRHFCSTTEDLVILLQKALIY